MTLPRGGVGLAIGGLALLIAAVYADPLFSRRNFVGRDLVAYNLPMEKTIHDAYARGHLPVWSPDVSGGRPLLPNPNAGALYPVRMLLAPLSFPLAMRLFPILHWLAAGTGTLLLLRRIRVSAPAAWVGATTYVFSGVAVSEVFFPHYLPGMACLPWIVWVLAGRETGPIGRILWLSLFFALLFLAGEVLIILAGIACCVLWILAEADRPHRPQAALEVLAALGLSALLAAPQIVASALWAGETRRASGLSIGEVTLYSLSPARLLELLIPYPFGPTWKLEPMAAWAPALFRGRPLGLFSTIYAGSLAVIAVPTLARRTAPGARFAKTLLALGLLATVIPALLPRALWRFPSLVPLRNPEKLAISVAFALAILASLAFDRLAAASSPSRGALAVGVVLFLAAVASLLSRETAARLAVGMTGGPPAQIPQAAASLPEALTEGALLWMLTVAALEAARRGGAPRVAIALGLLTLVPILATRKIPQLAGEDDVFAPTPFARLQRRRDPQNLYRTLGESVYRATPAGLTEPGSRWPPSPAWTWTEHTQALWGRGTVFNSDFDSGDLLRMESLRNLSSHAARYRDAEAFFGTLALRWGARFHGQETLAGYHAIGGDAICAWDEHAHPFAGIRLLEQWREEPSAAGALAAIPRLTPGSVVLETGRRSTGAALGGRVRLLEQTPERLLIETSAGNSGWLFVLREFWQWRRVLLDGREAPVVPAQIAFSAVPVPGGSHRIEWTEKVPGGKVSRWGPVLFLVIAAGLLTRHLRRVGR